MTKRMDNRLESRICLIRLGFIVYSFAVMAAIFLFSAQNGETSGALSSGLLQILLGWLRIYGSAELVELFHLLLRKLAHFLFMPCWALA